LPRPHLPGVLFKYLEQIPNCIFASNPVRIQYANQEIVILRNNLIEKMCRCVLYISLFLMLYNKVLRTALSPRPSSERSAIRTVVANPGSFSNGSFGFHVYLPFDRKIEDSAVDLEAAER
uniref:DNA polymerase II subunit 2 n=1 Tax=Heligmosomoides polygyrus TaxID=6339 RepID=A0A183GU10_HELPZ